MVYQFYHEATHRLRLLVSNKGTWFMVDTPADVVEFRDHVGVSYSSFIPIKKEKVAPFVLFFWESV